SARTSAGRTARAPPTAPAPSPCAATSAGRTRVAGRTAGTGRPSTARSTSTEARTRTRPGRPRAASVARPQVPDPLDLAHRALQRLRVDHGDLRRHPDAV